MFNIPGECCFREVEELLAERGITGPPPYAHEALSIANSRLPNWAQLMRARVEKEGVLQAVSE